MTTALIGLGAMGLGMARNVLAAGIPLRGFDLSERSLEAFAELGGDPAQSAADAADECKLVVFMVVNAAQIRAVLFEDGAAEAMAPGGVVVMTSTVLPDDARDIAGRLGDKGVLAIDAPVSGGQVGAEAGTLTIMASGPDAAFQRADAMLSAVAGKVYRPGSENSVGATFKVVHQPAAGVHLVAAAEFTAFRARVGCGPATLFVIVTRSAGNSCMLESRGTRMMQRDPAVTSAVDMFVKDIGLALELGTSSRASLPLAAAAHQMLLGASAMGHGRDDGSLVIRAYEVLTGTPVYKS